MGTAHVIAGIAFDPQIRGFLALGVGVVVLLGSVYLLLLTNIGSRLGFLIAVTAFWGWMFIMGGVWWAYGTVGMVGDLPKWEVKEVVYPDTSLAGLEEAHELDTSELPPVEEFFDLDPDTQTNVSDELEPSLGGWKILLESNPQFGEAKATVDEHFSSEPDVTLGLDGPEDYVAEYTFERGGKDLLNDDPSRLDRLRHRVETMVQLRHPPHYAILQIRPVIEQPLVPGEAPPVPKADESKPVVSVIMERNLGDRRFPGAMLTISSGIMFAVFAAALHRRDLEAMQMRAAEPAGV